MRKSISELIQSALGTSVLIEKVDILSPRPIDCTIPKLKVHQAELGNSAVQQEVVSIVTDYYTRWNKPSRILLGTHMTDAAMVIAPVK